MTVQEVLDLIAACEEKTKGLHPASQHLVTLSQLKMELDRISVLETDKARDPWFEVQPLQRATSPNVGGLVVEPETAANFALRSFFKGMGF